MNAIPVFQYDVLGQLRIRHEEWKEARLSSIKDGSTLQRKKWASLQDEIDSTSNNLRKTEKTLSELYNEEEKNGRKSKDLSKEIQNKKDYFFALLNKLKHLQKEQLKHDPQLSNYLHFGVYDLYGADIDLFSEDGGKGSFIVDLMYSKQEELMQNQDKWNRWEQGETEPTVNELLKIAAAFCMPFSIFYNPSQFCGSELVRFGTLFNHTVLKQFRDNQNIVKSNMHKELNKFCGIDNEFSRSTWERREDGRTCMRATHFSIVAAYFNKPAKEFFIHKSMTKNP